MHSKLILIKEVPVAKSAKRMQKSYISKLVDVPLL